jgi:hypothetical protein
VGEVTDTFKDPRVNSPACPLKTCKAPADSRFCVTPTGFPRGFHKARLQLIETGQAPAEKPAGSLAGRRPSYAQAGMLAFALSTDGNGLYEVSGYTFHGDAQRRATMQSMVDEARGWFEFSHSTEHCEVYRITDAGRAAYQRFDDWYHGRKP